MVRRIFLIVCFLCSLAFCVNGDMGRVTEPLTDGSDDYPYLIEDINDFDEFAENASLWEENVHTKLMCNIDLIGRTYNDAVIARDNNNSNWDGYNGFPFSGVFDGNYYTIFNLNIIAEENDFLALFGKINGNNAVVSNLTLNNVAISGNGYSFKLGSLCGENENGLISNCSAKGTIKAIGDYSEYIGGLCGYNTGNISNSSADFILSGIAHIGGLCGSNDDGYIVFCYALGSVTGGGKLGGLCGKNKGLISNCYAIATVSGTGDYVGGLCGYNYSSHIKNSFSAGQVNGGSHHGGLCGHSYNHIIENSFWDIETSMISVSVGGKGKTTVEMYNILTYQLSGWDFINEGINGNDDIWNISNGKGYPWLTWEPINIISDNDAFDIVEGGTQKINISLAKQPLVLSKINIDYNDVSLALEPNLITFTPDNFEIPQIIHVYAIEDNDCKNSVVNLEFKGNGIASRKIIANIIDNDVFPDMNNDGIVNIIELSNIAESWLLENPDFNLIEGINIDFNDFDILSNNWLLNFPIYDSFEYSNLSNSTNMWITEGEKLWFVVREYPNDGIYCLKSGNISDSQSCSLELIVCTDNYNTVSFARKTSCEINSDNLLFFIDGSLKGYWSGEQNWGDVEFNLGDGIQSLMWVYMKDSSGTSGSDCVWIDNINIR